MRWYFIVVLNIQHYWTWILFNQQLVNVLPSENVLTCLFWKCSVFTTSSTSLCSSIRGEIWDITFPGLSCFQCLHSHTQSADRISTASTFFQEQRCGFTLIKASSKETHLIYICCSYRSNILILSGSDGKNILFLYKLCISKLKSTVTPVSTLKDSFHHEILVTSVIPPGIARPLKMDISYLIRLLRQETAPLSSILCSLEKKRRHAELWKIALSLHFPYQLLVKHWS